MTDSIRLEVGRIGRAHGLRGELTVKATTNRTERFTRGATLYVGDRALVITSIRPHQDRFLVCFEGVSDRNAAEALRGKLLLGDASGEAPEGELWVHELIGSEVRERAGNVLGKVTAVEANPAHDLLVLDDGKLIPMVFVVEHEPGLVVVELPEGLLDL